MNVMYVVRVIHEDRPQYVGRGAYALEGDPRNARAYGDFDNAHDVVEKMRIENHPGLAEVIPHPDYPGGGLNYLAVAMGILGVTLGVIVGWAFGR